MSMTKSTETDIAAQAQTAGFDPMLLRKAMGQYATGVTVITVRDASGAPFGVTVNSFTSLSLDPPLLLFCMKNQSRILPLLKTAPSFAVHILAADQEKQCFHFAGKNAADFSSFAHSDRHGAPVLDGALCWMTCKLQAVHAGGDHEILVGEITDLGLERPDAPALIYLRGAVKA